jgi:hypothetical protein
MSDTVYVALCLLVPPLWGVLAARLFDALARRRKEPVAVEDERMYHI